MVPTVLLPRQSLCQMVARDDLVSSCQLARTGVDIPRHKDRAHMQLLGSRKVEETTQDYFDWVVLL